jgi:PAS domain S-box-containing protein
MSTDRRRSKTDAANRSSGGDPGSLVRAILDVGVDGGGPAHVGERLCRVVADGLGFPAVSVGRYDPVRRTVVLVAEHGRAAGLRSEVLAPEEAARAFLSHRARTFELPGPTDRPDIGVHVQLRIGGRAIGVLSALLPRDLPSTVEPLAALDPVAGAAAVVLAGALSTRMLQDAEDRLRGLVEYSAVASFGFDEAGRITFWNRLCVAAFGREPGDAVGSTLRDAIGEAIGAELCDRLAEAVLRGDYPPPFEWEQRQPDGTRRVLHSVFYPVFGREGEVIQGVATHLDVTERAALQESLESRNRRLARLLDATRELATNPSMEAVQETIVRNVVAHTRSDMGILSLFDPTTNTLERKHTIGADPATAPRLDLRPDEGVMGAVFRSGRPALVNRLDAAPTALVRRHTEALGIRSFLHVPLLREGRAIGVLSVAARTPDRFTEEDLDFMVGMAGLATVAIENAADRAEIERLVTWNRTILDHAPVGITLVDATGAILLMNREQLRIVRARDLDPRPYIGLNVLAAADFAEVHEVQLARDLLAGKAFSGEFGRGRLPDRDEEIVVNVTGTPVLGADGKVEYGLFLMEDVSAARRTARELDHARDTLREVFEHAEDIIALIAPDGTVVGVNEQACRITGRTRAELIGSEFGSYVHPDDRANARLWFEQTIGGGNVVQEVRLIAASGPRLFSVRGSILPGAGERPLAGIAILRDVHEKFLLEEQIRQGQRLESIGVLAGGVAHEFNNLLMGILGGASLLRRKLPEGTAEARKVEIIEKSAERAAMLTNQLLAFARGGKYQPVLADLNALVAEALDLFGASLEKRITLARECAPDLLPIEGDRTQLVQLVINLCQNAQEAIRGAGRIIVETRRAAPGELPEILRPRGQDYGVLIVRDSGPGVPEEAMDRIFDPFFTTKDYGRGLGLSAVYGIVQNHHGHIACDRAPEGGARFTVHLPASAGRLPALDANDTAANGHPAATILVVDDEEIPRETATSMIDSLGHRAVAAAGGPEAVEIFRANPDRIDLVLLDALMPRMDGSETFRRLLAIRPDVRVIVSSGYLEDMVLPADLRARTLGFLKKPYRVKELGVALRLALRNP